MECFILYHGNEKQILNMKKETYDNGMTPEYTEGDTRVRKNEFDKAYFVCYLTQRPPSIGTHPTEKLISIKEGVSIEAKPGRTVTKLKYDRPLTIKEINKFELMPALDKKHGGNTYHLNFGRHTGLLHILSISECGTVITVQEIWGEKKTEEETFSFRGLIAEYPKIDFLHLIKPEINQAW
jgi:hypothetical protein